MSYYTSEFPLKARIIAWVSRRFHFSYTARSGVTRGLRRVGGLAFLPRAQQSAEERFLRRLDLSNKVVYDIGGYIGLMTLFFASKAARVVTYEPSPSVREAMRANLKANGFNNVTIRPLALGAKHGALTMVFSRSMSGATSGDPDIKEALLESASDADIIDVEVTTLDSEIGSGSVIPDLVKIDVEGMEYPVLQGMVGLVASRHPALYIELHGAGIENKIRNAHAVVQFLRDHGYRVYDVENARYVKETSGKESHIYAQ